MQASNTQFLMVRRLLAVVAVWREMRLEAKGIVDALRGLRKFVRAPAVKWVAGPAAPTRGGGIG
jgi:hypothetical protein